MSHYLFFASGGEGGGGGGGGGAYSLYFTVIESRTIYVYTTRSMCY